MIRRMRLDRTKCVGDVCVGNVSDQPRHALSSRDEESADTAANDASLDRAPEMTNSHVAEADELSMGHERPGHEALALSVVIPCLNERANIDAVYREVVTELAEYQPLEVLFVDDGSTDGTLEAIKSLAEQDSRVSYLSFTRNFGFEAAFSAGYRYAHRPWILHLDADLQFPPSTAHSMVAQARQGFDAVFGVRTHRHDPWHRRLASKTHDYLARRLLRIEMPAHATSFRLVRASLARAIVDLDLGTPYFLATVPRMTRRWTTVPTGHRARTHGQSKVTFGGLARHALGLFLGFSRRPLLSAVGAGLLACVAFLLAVLAEILGSHTTAHAGLGVGGAFTAWAVAMVSGSVLIVRKDQRRTPSFLIAEANFALRPEDDLRRETDRMLAS
jgi:polyisoprenyl-phosphate glycosyltransferase